MAEDTDKTEDTGTQDTETEDTGTQDTETEDTGTQDQDQEKDKDPEKEKLIRRRDAALRRAQQAEEREKALRDKYEPKDQDPETKANRKLVRAEFKVVAAKAGVADEDLKDLASFLDLDSVPVDGDGEVDADMIQERLDTLGRIFGKLSGSGGRSRGPRLDTRDKGGEKAKPMDPASKRRRDMLAGR
jgi:hypothetical protein